MTRGPRQEAAQRRGEEGEGFGRAKPAWALQPREEKGGPAFPLPARTDMLLPPLKCAPQNC